MEKRWNIYQKKNILVGITEEEYLDDRISVSRNKVIADIFFRLGIIERLATGIRRIKEHYRKFNVKPDFLISKNAVKIVLPFTDIDSNSERVNEDANDYRRELSHSERIIIDYIKDNKQLNRIDAEQILGLKKTYTVEILNSMISKGIIRRVGKGRGTVYILE